MNYKIVGVILCLVGLAVLTSGCIVEVTTVAPGYYGVPTYYNSGAGAQVAVISNQITKDAAGNAVGFVTVKNVSNVTAGLVAIDAKFYSSQNVVVYSAQDSTMNLLPGQTWDFTISTTVSYSVAKTLQVQVTATSSGGY
jgi:hypothetical protein